VHHKLWPGRVEPPITLAEFEHYLYWNNRGWGTQTETVSMVVSTSTRHSLLGLGSRYGYADLTPQAELYRNGLMDLPVPVPGAREALLELKRRGYTLVVITARSETQREGTEKWLETHLPDSAYECAVYY
jgi:phosphoglycolate phosphatase-like HAD superfamily hydrolase